MKVKAVCELRVASTSSSAVNEDKSAAVSSVLVCVLPLPGALPLSMDALISGMVEPFRSVPNLGDEVNAEEE